MSFSCHVTTNTLYVLPGLTFKIKAPLSGQQQHILHKAYIRLSKCRVKYVMLTVHIAQHIMTFEILVTLLPFVLVWAQKLFSKVEMKIIAWIEITTVTITSVS